MAKLKSIFIIFTAFTLSVVSSAADHAWYSPNANPNYVDTISIRLTDNAKDVCWTNLMDVREYSKEKLELQDYRVVSEMGNFTFRVNVDSFRDSQGWCVYSVELTIDTNMTNNGVVGIFKIGNVRSSGVSRAHVNSEVISAIQKMIDEM